MALPFLDALGIAKDFCKFNHLCSLMGSCYMQKTLGRGTHEGWPGRVSMLQACCLGLDPARQTRGSASGSKLACMASKLHNPMCRRQRVDSIFFFLSRNAFQLQ